MRWDWVQMEWGGDRTGLAGLGRDGVWRFGRFRCLAFGVSAGVFGVWRLVLLVFGVFGVLRFCCFWRLAFLAFCVWRFGRLAFGVSGGVFGVWRLVLLAFGVFGVWRFWCFWRLAFLAFGVWRF